MTTVTQSKIAQAHWHQQKAERKAVKIEGALERAEAKLAEAAIAHDKARAVIHDHAAEERQHEIEKEDLRYQIALWALLYLHQVRQFHTKKRLRKRCRGCGEVFPCQTLRRAEATRKVVTSRAE